MPCVKVQKMRRDRDKYQLLEASLIGEGKAVDFKSMKKELAARKMSKPTVKEAMIYKGKVVDNNDHSLRSYVMSGHYVTTVVFIFIILSLVVIIFWMIRSKVQK